MIVWPGLRRSMGTRAGIPIANRAAHFDASLGITSSGGFASAWADQSGNARNLLQATGANQPIHLPFSGAKYAANFGVAGNLFTTPDAAANQISGSKTILLTGLRLGSVAPAGYSSLVDRAANAGTGGYAFFQDQASSGKIVYFHHTGGSLRTALSSATLASVGAAAETAFDLAVTHNTTSGEVKFWYKLSGGSWTQLGSTVASTVGVTTLGSSNMAVFGRADSPTLYNNTAKVSRVKLYDGIVTDLDAGTGGTLKADMTPDAWTSGTTFVSSATGETWTINSTGAKPAQIVDRSSLLFDGAAHYMKTAPFTLNQPETVFLVARQITWTATDTLLDGNSVNTGAVTQTTGTPQINLNAGASVAGNTEMTLSERKVVCSVFNGASSSLQITTGTATTGNAGAGNMGGLTLGAAGSNLLFSNIQAYELLAYSAALDAATRANIIRSLMSKHGVT